MTLGLIKVLKLAEISERSQLRTLRLPDSLGQQEYAAFDDGSVMGEIRKHKMVGCNNWTVICI
ncbi:hypothetical protein F2Q69_00017031 [Brassica cretica]|uniref:Uncharacterized protein n=1 Tax=Brassica cretica TaxID=69181 RepID=A0A8S9R9A7_BRACR|nr:hypothetical protein F2Q69_00017031 [Brassica cretica]